MAHADAAERALREGDPGAALTELQNQVRAKPGDAKLRVFLFQLLAVLGQWERALNQLTVASNLDASALAMAQMYGEAVRCEAMRASVFAGKKSPLIFGEPEEWLALMIEALLVAGAGSPEKSFDLRARALEQAETNTGTIDDKPFEWIADADSRLGPILEAVINGRYYWVPFSRLMEITIEEPSDLRDCVWMPVHLMFSNGGDSVALIPTRYPGSESSSDGLISLARKTEWREAGPDTWFGLGQRLFATDAGETPLMDARKIIISATAAESGGNG